MRVFVRHLVLTFFPHSLFRPPRAQVATMLRASMTRATALLTDEKDAHDRLTRALLEHETLTGQQLRQVLDGLDGLPPTDK